MKTWIRLVALISLTCLTVIGCSKGGGGGGNAFSAEKGKLFASDPTMKTLWDTGEAAIKTNDYFTAGMSIRALLGQPNLTDPQRVALTESSRQLFEELEKKAKDKDPAAKKAQEQFRAAGG